MRAVQVLLAVATSATAAVLQSPEAAAPVAVERRAPTTYWYEQIKHNGYSPFIANGKNWTVYRNVKDPQFGAVGDGVADDTAAIQKALNFGNGTVDRAGFHFGTTGQPAVVYIPAGTYRITAPIQSYVFNIIMGDPINPPVLQASADFSDPFLWYAKDPNLDSTINFYIGMKNLVLDSTKVPAAQNITLLDWSVSQAVQLTNVLFNMGGAGHTGLSMPEGGSPLMMNDLEFRGGAVGIRMNEQQYHFKGLTFKSKFFLSSAERTRSNCDADMGIGLKLDKLFEGTGQGLRFESCQVGVDTSNNNTGFFALIDSSATNTNILFNASNSPNAQGSIILENVVVDSSVASVSSNRLPLLAFSCANVLFRP